MPRSIDTRVPCGAREPFHSSSKLRLFLGVLRLSLVYSSLPELGVRVGSPVRDACFVKCFEAFYASPAAPAVPFAALVARPGQFDGDPEFACSPGDIGLSAAYERRLDVEVRIDESFVARPDCFAELGDEVGPAI